jgi:hypothetical protein
LVIRIPRYVVLQITYTMPRATQISHVAGRADGRVGGRVEGSGPVPAA